MPSIKTGTHWSNFCLIQMLILRCTRYMRTLMRAHVSRHPPPQRGGTAFVAGGGGGVVAAAEAAVVGGKVCGVGWGGWIVDHLLLSPGTYFTWLSQMLEIGHTWQHSSSEAGYKCAFLARIGCKNESLLSLLYYPLHVLAPIRYSKQRDNWQIGIELLMRKRQTEAEMKRWLPIQIAVITISTLKLCNNLYSNALLRWED